MADNQITPFQLTDQFTMDNFNQRIEETNTALQNKAPAGFGWGDGWSGLLSAESLTYSEYCASVDGLLDTMPNQTSKLVIARGPDETGQYYGAGNIIAVLSRVSASDASLTGLSVSPSNTRKGLWRMIKSNGVWDSPEWIIAPMIIGIEYRTTERYMGKPVYIKLVDCGALPNATTKDIAYTTEVTTYVAHGGHFANGTNTYSITDYGVNSSIRCWVALKNICIKCTGDSSSYNAYVWVKYTKTTD